MCCEKPVLRSCTRGYPLEEEGLLDTVGLANHGGEKGRYSLCNKHILQWQEKEDPLDYFEYFQ